MGKTEAMTQADWLTSTDGKAAIAAARRAGEGLAATASLRRSLPDLSPEQVSAAMTQAALLRLAFERYGIEGDWLLTRDGLEQATRPEVARLRARALAEAGVRHVIDATAGLGFDSAAFLTEGMQVSCIERDATTAVFLAHNLPGAEIIHGDAAEVVGAQQLNKAVVFVDPARRDHRRSADGSRALPERDPEKWSPPWSWIQDVAARTRVCAKVAPGFNAPPGWQSTWTSVDASVVDCFVTSWPLSSSDARAVVIRQGLATAIDVDSNARLSVSSTVRRFVHEPDPAVIRAGGIDSLGSVYPGLMRLDEQGTWLTSDDPCESPLWRSYEVIAELASDRKQRRRALAEHAVTKATVKTRDVDIDPRQALRDLGLVEGSGPTIVMCRGGDRVRTLLTRPRQS